ncbi:DUF429 domain-containing protein [Accumulibacter sp.]|jgi:predicted nuclease with RNAse H fold|uniref:DUF429 domain-containing protein n=1 Tax=Accumulibacter sp. TaxID=2053492 RepID=UPI001AD2061E|nr:DUF429 domain-containing protein [Accumulibacter sp.]MBN8453933.1 DUF429 domain-containing protein [Accumulibacter sp.]
MTSGPTFWIGADPGGRGNFGIAILAGNDKPQTASVNCADEAVVFVRARVHHPPAGVGVDAPLWWSSGPSGDRHADQWLRRTYGLGGGQVQAANSLRGAALVQGAMFVQRIREAYPAVPVTESHPTALLNALLGNDWATFAARFHVNAEPRNQHERDALIAAVAAREGFTGNWTHDLGQKRLAGEQDPARYWLAPVHYYWPEAR